MLELTLLNTFKPIKNVNIFHITDQIKVKTFVVVVNGALLSMHGGSLEITLTVPSPHF